MSQYITLDELPKLSIRASALNNLSDEDKLTAIVTASGEADGYIRARYELPLAEPYDDGLKYHVASVAVYIALKARGGFSPQSDDDLIIQDRNDAVRYFRDIAMGRVQFAISDAGTSVDSIPDIYSDDERGYGDTYV